MCCNGPCMIFKSLMMKMMMMMTGDTNRLLPIPHYGPASFHFLNGKILRHSLLFVPSPDTLGILLLAPTPRLPDSFSPSLTSPPPPPPPPKLVISVLVVISTQGNRVVELVFTVYLHYKRGYKFQLLPQCIIMYTNILTFLN